ncbi:MAG: 16S rRNA (adenine(1518)-N(6)/adenine(1519)-N(6))-dimethyltransferase RsmA [Clostridiales bacterium]|nr:16S rRNA (adenine(1518)-N(6)/adenine(1519)-N(6))-dimethyltransferase RsmA [Clostridiales bacterium]MCF8021546.1 16S rRNA (adenine(1518)-N(6)/adenine(1519)-N(6))-dimethyltransferase RsmA [Clostridiales bacterium]
MELTSLNDVRDLMNRHDFRCQKKLGQNFLVDANIINTIIKQAELDELDIAVEIGPGLGTLTKKIAEKCRIILAIELDRKLVPILNETLAFADNATVIHNDALKINYDNLVKHCSSNYFPDKKQDYKVIANLPYYITTPLIMHLLENGFNFSDMVVMVQEEVARRMTASPGTKDYGALSLAVQFYTKAKILKKVSKHVFIPRPEVGSALVKLQRREKYPVAVDDTKTFFSIIRAAFGKRRKTLINALSNSTLGVSKEQWSSIIKSAGIKPTRRSEELGIDEFAALYEFYVEYRANY